MTDTHQTAESNDQKFQNLQRELQSCRHCQSDFGFEPHPILFGNPHAKIMQIGQAPSRILRL